MSEDAGQRATASVAPVLPGRGPWRRRIRWLLVLVGLGGTVTALALRASRGGAVAKLDKSLIATVKRGALEITVLETGRVEPRTASQIKSRLGGQVREVTVEEGEQVEVGQVLMRLDATDYRRETARVAAEHKQQRLQAEQQERELERARRARTSRIAPETELESAESQAALARARLEAGAAAVLTARDRLRYTEIEAPIAGTVIQRNIQPGEAVVPGATSTFEGKPLLVIADLSVLLVKVDLNQIDVAKVRKGMKAQVSLDALPGKTFHATVTRVAPASSATGVRGNGSTPDVFPIEAVLDAGQELREIKPGMTADVRILVETRPNVLRLPIEALQTTGGKTKVQRLELTKGQDAPAEREVTVGARNDREVEIVSGLVENDRVLISPPAVEKK